MNKSFTLIEILVVIVVIGVLSAFILVGMSSITSKANIARGQALANSLDNSLLLSRISYWKLDEGSSSTTISDSWGINIGTFGVSPDNPTWLDSGCVSNKCLSFDGITDYVQVPSQPVLCPLDGITLEAWINFGRLSYATYQEVIGKNTHAGYRFNVSSSTKLVSFVTATAGGYDTISSADLTEGNWYHVVGTYNSTNNELAIFVNGNKYSKTHLYGGKLTSNPDYLWIGRRDAGNNFKGLIDDIRLYSQAVPASKIKQNYFVGINKLFKNNGITFNEFNQRLTELKSNLSNNE
jgi:prepilin-type N-terminal cleavage/methylation domain-containing protein